VSPRRILKATTCVEAVRPGDEERGGLPMSTIPLHLQRKFEQRWAARFASPAASAAPKYTDSKGTVANWPRPAKAKANPLSSRKSAMPQTNRDLSKAEDRRTGPCTTARFRQSV
jgi:hypothetical protein